MVGSEEGHEGVPVLLVGRAGRKAGQGGPARRAALAVGTGDKAEHWPGTGTGFILKRQLLEFISLS